MIKITKKITFDKWVFECYAKIIDYIYGIYGILNIFRLIVKRIMITVVIYYYIAIIHDYFEGFTSIKKLG